MKRTAQGLVPSRVLLASLCAVALLLTLAASPASALEFGSVGTGAGQIEGIKGIATEAESGDIYVADYRNYRIDKFDAAGNFLFAFGWAVRDGAQELQTCTEASGCQRGVRGSGVGQLFFEGRPQVVALDNSPGSASERDLYVIDGNNRIQKFTPAGEFLLMFGGEVDKSTGADVCTAASGDECGKGVEGSGPGQFQHPEAIAVAPSGEVFVADRERVQRFSAAGAQLGEFSVPLPAQGSIPSIAVDSAGLVDVAVQVGGEETCEVRRFSAAGTAEGTFAMPPDCENVHVTTDAAGHLFVDDNGYEQLSKGRRRFHDLLELDSSLAVLKSFPPRHGENLALPGFNFDRHSGGLLVGGELGGDPESNIVYAIPLPPPGPYVYSQAATPRAGGRVTFSAQLNAEGEETTYHFAYGTSPGTETASASGTIGAGFERQDVEIEAHGLAASTTYYFHAVAENAEGTVEEADGSFETLPPISVDSISASHVSATTALLEAEVNPYASDTTVTFTYSDGETTLSTEPVDIGEGEEEVAVEVEVEGLEPDTEYSYSVFAENPLGSGELGPARLITRHSAGLLGLLDGRSWELVSPANKHGASLESVNPGARGGYVEAAATGGGIVYGAVGAIEEEPIAQPSGVAVLSRHGAGGWASEQINPPNREQFAIRLNEVSEFWLFSPDLERSFLVPSGFTPLSPYTTERTSYLRVQPACEEGSPDCYMPLASGDPEHGDVEAGIEFGSPYQGALKAELPYVKPVAADRSLSHLVVSSSVALLPGGPASAIYEWSPAEPRRLALLSVRPGGEAVSGCLVGPGSGDPEVGGRGLAFDATHAVAEGGSRVVWTEGGSGSGCQGHLYLREVGAERTVKIDAVAAGASGTGPVKPVYRGASADDALVFFTDTQQLTADSRAEEGKPDLYAYDAAAEALTDLSVPVGGGEAADVQGVAGISEDGSVVYLVADGALAAGAEAGDCRLGSGGGYLGSCGLYRERYDASSGEWQASFIATLSNEDNFDWAANMGEISARASHDGNLLAFMSKLPLTGYDNRDLASGRRDEEVFLYDAAAAGGAGKILCASCNPTGGRPEGFEVPARRRDLPLGLRGTWGGVWIAAWLPLSHFATEAGAAANNVGGFYQPRYLSDSGRLFFNSPDALASQDTNHLEDVYEYEPPAGEGAPPSDTCTAASETFSVRAEGCIGLVSSGSSERESVFMDASETGQDAFILTAARLSPEDIDTAYDVYDAHVCGAGWACEPPGSGPEPPCETTASCHPAEAQAGSGVAAGGSEAAEGPGNPKGGGGHANSCQAPARRAAGLSHRAKELRRAARRLRRKDPRRAHRLKARAHRLARRASRLAKRTRRCRRAHRRANTNGRTYR